MTTQYKKIAQVQGVGKVIETIPLDFYTTLITFQKAGAGLITPSQELKSRIQTSGNKNIGKFNGTWTTYGFEYIGGETPLLKQDSRLLNPNLAQQAVQANKGDQYFHTPTTKEYELSLKQAEKDIEPWKKQALKLPSRTNFTISPDNNFEVLEFLARNPKLAREFYEFNRNSPITVDLVSTDKVDSQSGTILTQLWIYCLDYGRSDLDGNDRSLKYIKLEARGVLKNPAKQAQTRKSNLTIDKKEFPYSKSEIKSAYELVKGVQSGKLGILKLKKPVSLLEKILKEQFK